MKKFIPDNPRISNSSQFGICSHISFYSYHLVISIILLSENSENYWHLFMKNGAWLQSDGKKTCTYFWLVFDYY